LKWGFTLIELSIVLVIIGLIVGGILVGQDLILAAGVRAQVSQIEKYNQAVNAFRDKYGALPGDLNQTVATQFGFLARGTNPGEGDGNGLIEGDWNGSYAHGEAQMGETQLFWADLSTAGLIDGSFVYNSTTGLYSNRTALTTPNIAAFVPAAKIGGGNYVSVYTNDNTSFAPGYGPIGNTSYFSISVVTEYLNGNIGMTSSVGMTPAQANAIDTKIDDDNPLKGRVLAMYNATADFQWADSSWDSNLNAPTAPDAMSASSATCFDNSVPPATSGNNWTQMHYTVNQGAGVNCAISIQFQ
jgi:prepilin-type N-terminal cleavage/methylation domain-containing protein